MAFIYPDLEWYTGISIREGVSPRCPYANVNRCPRYYYSLYLLGKIGTTTKIKPEIIEELDSLWEKSDLLPVVDEHDTQLTGNTDKTLGYYNFCPEISYDIFGLFADYLHRYSDEIEHDFAHEQLTGEAHDKDWRWQWANISTLHYVKCPVYSQLLTRVETDTKQLPSSGEVNELVEIKPSIMGISLNMKELLNRLARWWLKR